MRIGDFVPSPTIGGVGMADLIFLATGGVAFLAFAALAAALKRV
jgi:hypothetical protein